MDTVHHKPSKERAYGSRHSLQDAPQRTRFTTAVIALARLSQGGLFCYLPPMNLPNRQNIAIIGNGIAGLLCAYELQKHGHNVTIFTANTPSASSLALGMLVPSSLQRPIDALQREGISLWHPLATELATQQKIPLSSFFRIWPQGSQLNVSQILIILQNAFVQLGGQIQNQTITNPQQLIHIYQKVLIAAGTQTPHLIQAIAPSSLPCSWNISTGQAIRLQTPTPLPAPVVADNLFIVPDWNNTTMVGSKSWTLRPAESPSNTPNPNHTQELFTRAIKLAPTLTNATILESWVGHRPISNPRLPLLHNITPQVWAVAGLGKVGYALAPCVAQSVLKHLT